MIYRDRRGRDRMVAVFTNIFTISDYHHWRCEFESRLLDVSSVQPDVIKFVSDFWQVVGFLCVRWFDAPIKLAVAI